MQVEKFAEALDCDFYTGVPDSQLKALCNYLIKKYGTNPSRHIIAANEGNCTALAAGYHLACGKTPVIYLQNSGEGNIINPVASLLNDKVYAIPVIFVIGWRGEPNVKDEPQHVYQGEVTLKLLDDMDISYHIISDKTTLEELSSYMSEFKALLNKGKSVAFVVKKGALHYDEKINYANNNKMKREEIIERIVHVSNKDIIISTTGKASRELFEIREKNHQSHECDFLTVGSMGHASSIALGVALNKPDKKVWCIDGDGALLMHMGAMAIIGANKPKNFVHVLINNASHETVGGMPTVANSVDFCKIAFGCGYENVLSVDNSEDLNKALKNAKENNLLTFLEAKCAIGAREDLGRPTIAPIQNKESFMLNLN